MKYAETGKRIKDLRKKANYPTQGSLAEAMQVNQSTISSWEQGQNLPDSDLLEDLAKKLKTSIDYIITGVELENKRQVDEYNLSNETLEYFRTNFPKENVEWSEANTECLKFRNSIHDVISHERVKLINYMEEIIFLPQYESINLQQSNPSLFNGHIIDSYGDPIEFDDNMLESAMLLTLNKMIQTERKKVLENGKKGKR